LNAGELRAVLVLLGVFVLPSSARAQEAAVGKFLLGATAGLVLHESGHLAFDLIFDASPSLRGVSFGPLPFFAITHRRVSPAREFVISSAGFWMQQATNEIILSRHDRNAGYVVKGLLAFNTLASFAYAGAASARAGPVERDTRGMAESARLAEPWIGGVVLVPAVLDAAWYFKPESRWLRWGSRAAKIGGVLLVLKARD
jgi:hypothetical protein